MLSRSLPLMWYQLCTRRFSPIVCLQRNLQCGKDWVWGTERHCWHGGHHAISSTDTVSCTGPQGAFGGIVAVHGTAIISIMPYLNYNSINVQWLVTKKIDWLYAMQCHTTQVASFSILDCTSMCADETFFYLQFFRQMCPAVVVWHESSGQGSGCWLGCQLSHKLFLLLHMCFVFWHLTRQARPTSFQAGHR